MSYKIVLLACIIIISGILVIYSDYAYLGSQLILISVLGLLVIYKFTKADDAKILNKKVQNLLDTSEIAFKNINLMAVTYFKSNDQMIFDLGSGVMISSKDTKHIYQFNVNYLGQYRYVLVLNDTGITVIIDGHPYLVKNCKDVDDLPDHAESAIKIIAIRYHEMLTGKSREQIR